MWRQTGKVEDKHVPETLKKFFKSQEDIHNNEQHLQSQKDAAKAALLPPTMMLTHHQRCQQKLEQWFEK